MEDERLAGDPWSGAAGGEARQAGTCVWLWHRRDGLAERPRLRVSPAQQSVPHTGTA